MKDAMTDQATEAEEVEVDEPTDDPSPYEDHDLKDGVGVQDEEATKLDQELP